MNRRRYSPILSCLPLAASLLASLPGCSHLPFRRHKDDPATSQAAVEHLKVNAQGLSSNSSPRPIPSSWARSASWKSR